MTYEEKQIHYKPKIDKIKKALKGTSLYEISEIWLFLKEDLNKSSII